MGLQKGTNKQSKNDNFPPHKIEIPVKIVIKSKRIGKTEVIIGIHA